MPKFFESESGDLLDYDTLAVIRKKFKWHYRDITKGKELLATLRAGEYAWPGGYRLFFITSDGATISFDTVRDNLANILDSIRTHRNDGWRVIACESTANCDDDVFCDHSGDLIE